jgi:RNA polymerase sigma-70 factor (ECF subfamily)
MDAFDRFVEIFRTRIFQYSYLMCGHREDAEEVAQDALLNAFENFDKLREPESVRPWMFRIARNACLMKRRKSVFAPAHEMSLEEYLSGDGHQLTGHSILPFENVLQGELHEALREAIQDLPPTYRAVILLRDMEELSTEETAQILDITTDLVKQRLHRARVALKRLLGLRLQPREALHE